MVAELSTINWFLPIFAFLLVFVVVYAILKKTEILGDNSTVSLFISLIIAAFFIVQTQLVDFVVLTSSWMAVIAIILFFLFLALAFIPGKNNLDFITKGNWFGIVVFVLMIIFFLVASGYIFSWAVNWDILKDLASKEWFGFVILIIIAAITASTISKQ